VEIGDPIEGAYRIRSDTGDLGEVMALLAIENGPAFRSCMRVGTECLVHLRLPAEMESSRVEIVEP
jgi:hypothetical protein